MCVREMLLEVCKRSVQCSICVFVRAIKREYGCVSIIVPLLSSRSLLVRVLKERASGNLQEKRTPRCMCVLVADQARIWCVVSSSLNSPIDSYLCVYVC